MGILVEWMRVEEKEWKRREAGTYSSVEEEGGGGVIVSGALEVSNFFFNSLLMHRLNLFLLLSYFLQTTRAFCRPAHSSQAPACRRQLLPTRPTLELIKVTEKRRK